MKNLPLHGLKTPSYLPEYTEGKETKHTNHVLKFCVVFGKGIRTYSDNQSFDGAILRWTKILKAVNRKTKFM